MGFGSYDESEQENQEMMAEDEDAEGINIHESEHDGDLTFESDVSTDDLVNKLDEIKDASSED